MSSSHLWVCPWTWHTNTIVSHPTLYICCDTSLKLVPPDHVSQFSGYDMAHPQFVHTHCKMEGGGEDRESVWEERGGKTHYSDGGGESVSCPIFSVHFLPTAAHTCLHVCAYVYARASHACMSDMWPAAAASILTLWESWCRKCWGKSRENNGSKVEKQLHSKLNCCAAAFTVEIVSSLKPLFTK